MGSDTIEFRGRGRLQISKGSDTIETAHSLVLLFDRLVVKFTAATITATGQGATASREFLVDSILETITPEHPAFLGRITYFLEQFFVDVTAEQSTVGRLPKVPVVVERQISLMRYDEWVVFAQRIGAIT